MSPASTPKSMYSRRIILTSTLKVKFEFKGQNRPQKMLAEKISKKRWRHPVAGACAQLPGLPRKVFKCHAATNQGRSPAVTLNGRVWPPVSVPGEANKK